MVSLDHLKAEEKQAKERRAKQQQAVWARSNMRSCPRRKIYLPKQRLPCLMSSCGATASDNGQSMQLWRPWMLLRARCFHVLRHFRQQKSVAAICRLSVTICSFGLEFSRLWRAHLFTMRPRKTWMIRPFKFWWVWRSPCSTLSWLMLLPWPWSTLIRIGSS